MKQKQHRRRRGFIFVVGYRVRDMTERGSLTIAPCPHCKVPEARLVGRIRRAWFTMFFMPILPLDPKSRAERFSHCRECGFNFAVPIEQLLRRTNAANANTLADTFVVYNSLRDDPANGAILLKLLTMYAGLNEPDEAESAARHFPAALAAEPKCVAVLEELRATAAS